MKRNEIEYNTDERDLVETCADNRSEYISDAISEAAEKAFMSIIGADTYDDMIKYLQAPNCALEIRAGIQSENI